MQKTLLVLLFVSAVAQAKYMDNKSCSECHEKIYNEFKSSFHSRGYYNDELHRKIARKVNKNSYECAVCHMPSASNLKKLLSSKAMPDKTNVTHTDAISCYVCHTIAFVKKSHKYNLIQKTKEIDGFKPTYYGRLKEPDENDNHESLKNPIYAKNACTGCHSHKLNDQNTTIFRAIKDNENSLGCIKCHMPVVEGGVEGFDRKARGKHVSHRFLGIRDKEFRKKGLDIEIQYAKNTITVKIKNKMGHPLIIQPARAKYIKVELLKNNNVIWQNYKDHPSEDKQSYFAKSFKENGKKVIIPSSATEVWENNIDTNSTKILSYEVKNFDGADKIVVSEYLKLAKDDCAKVIDLEDKSFLQEQLIKKVEIPVRY